MTSLDLTGRTAIITGASRGIGLAIAQQLAAAGANVVLTARKQEAADEAAAQVGEQALGVGAHAVDEDAARRCVDLTLERFGSVDILINNAGTNPAYGPLIDQDHARFTKIFDVNLWAPLLWTSLVVKAWMGEHGGAIVNTASIGGMHQSAGDGDVQRHQGRADPRHQATGAGTFTADPGQCHRPGGGAHQAGRGAVEGPRRSAGVDDRARAHR